MLSNKQKKKSRKIILILTITILVILFGWIIFQQLTVKKKSFVRYPEFGISMPENYLIHGIDVSKYQSRIGWEEVRSMKVKNIQLGFSFIKATEGIGNTDPQFRRNWKKAKENGIARGAYHFFIASKDGRMQAENFIDKVKLESGDLPPVLDVEQLNGTNPVKLRNEIQKWLSIVENHFQVKPIIYTNVDFYNRYIGNDFDDYPLWVAHYYQLEQPRIQRGWIFWQHSDKGRVNGIYSKVDFNVFNGDSTAFKELLID